MKRVLSMVPRMRESYKKEKVSTEMSKNGKVFTGLLDWTIKEISDPKEHSCSDSFAKKIDCR